MERAPVRAPLIKNLEFKVGLLVAITLALAVGFVSVQLYTRGVFEHSQRVILVVNNAEGITQSMPVTFMGSPIGKVKRIEELDDQLRVRVELAIPEKNAKWLRASSLFTLKKALIGGTKLMLTTTLADMASPQLTEGATCEPREPGWQGQSAQHCRLQIEEPPEIEVTLRKIDGFMANLNALTANDSNLSQTLANLQTVSDRMTSKYGVIGGLLGDETHAQKVITSLDRANTLLHTLNGASLKVDSILGKTETQVLGPDGVVPEARKAAAQVNALLTEVRGSLQKVDAILQNTQAISAEVKQGTTDLARLRSEVDDSLIKVNHLINEVNRKWPFAREGEIKLP